MLKYFVLRTNRGRVIDLAKGEAHVLAGEYGTFEILAGGGGVYRVSVDAVSCLTGGVNHLPSFLSDGTHAVLVELIRDDEIVDSQSFSLEVKPCPKKFCPVGEIPKPAVPPRSSPAKRSTRKRSAKP